MKVIKTKEMDYLVPDEEADNVEKLIQGGAEYIKLRSGTMLSKYQILSIERSPEADPSRLIGGKTEWQLKNEAIEKQKSKKKRVVKIVNGVPQFVIE